MRSEGSGSTPRPETASNPGRMFHRLERKKLASGRPGAPLPRAFLELATAVAFAKALRPSSGGKLTDEQWRAFLARRAFPARHAERVEPGETAKRVLAAACVDPLPGPGGDESAEPTVHFERLLAS